MNHESPTLQTTALWLLIFLSQRLLLKGCMPASKSFPRNSALHLFPGGA
jgi:hypothetical protein